MEEKDKSLWKKLPFRTRHIIVTVIGGFVFIILFLIVMVIPLTDDSIGIIDISGISSTTPSSGVSYSDVVGNTGFWWPLATTEDGLLYDDGEPASTRITSSFGDEESFRTSKHGGIDIGNNGYGKGVINVIASKSGKVIYPTSTSQTSYRDNGHYGNTDGGGYGNYVMIEHNDGSYTLYAHLAQNSITVLAGDIVKQGQVIGKLGNSGSSTGPHLHFEVIKDGTKKYPLNYISAENPRPKTPQNIVGTSAKQSVCLNLKELGVPDNGVAAIMTNIQHESGFNPTAHGDKENGVYTSYGLCQWHNERMEELMNTFPDSYDTVFSQMKYLMYELENISYYNDTYVSVMDPNKSVYDSAYTFCYNFEIPSNREVKCKERAEASSSFAEYVYNGCQ